MKNILAWQHPTEWSMETHDGVYYIEENRKGTNYEAYHRTDKYLGCFDDIMDAVDACQKHYEISLND